jgi:hypothetical protein
MDRARLVQLINEFATLATDCIPVQYSDESEPSTLTLPELLRIWGKEPQCMLSTMFLGYCIGEGEDINAFSPEALHLAVLSACDVVEFDWLGDIDATSKPH